MILLFVPLCSVAFAVSGRSSPTIRPRHSGVRFALSPGLRRLAAMADQEALAIVPYAGPPHPLMIRCMLDEARGNT